MSRRSDRVQRFTVRGRDQRAAAEHGHTRRHVHASFMKLMFQDILSGRMRTDAWRATNRDATPNSTHIANTARDRCDNSDASTELSRAPTGTASINVR